MKNTRVILFLLAVAVAVPFASATGWLLAALAVFIVGNLLGTPVPGRLCVTLTVSEILADVLAAFKKSVPMLRFFSYDQSGAAKPAKYGQTVIAQIPSLPTAYDYVVATGYEANAQNARDLLTDVPIVINQWKHVPFKLMHDDVNEDRSMNYLKAIDNAGYVLAKAVVDYALGKVVAANFTRSTVASIGNTSKDTLNALRIAMNTNGAGAPRYGLVSSAFYGALDADTRIASKDYYGQMIGENPVGSLRGVSGFKEILEYPDLPGNAEYLSGFFFDSRAIAVATRIPEDSTTLANSMGIPVTYKTEVMQDPETGITLVAYSHINQNTHQIHVSITVMYGAVAGAQGGAQDALTDKAGWRIKTQ